MKRLLFTLAAIAAPLLPAGAQANLSFSGGNGIPLTMTLQQSVQYTINSVPTTGAPAFVFVGLGNLFPSLPSFTGSITYSVNGAGAFSLTQIGSGFTGGNISSTDAFLFNNFVPLFVGDVVRLNAGTLTSAVNFAPAAPTSKAYATFIIEDGGAQRSTLGVSTSSVVPEPSTYLLMVAGLSLLGITARRRKTAR